MLSRKLVGDIEPNTGRFYSFWIEEKTEDFVSDFRINTYSIIFYFKICMTGSCSDTKLDNMLNVTLVSVSVLE